MEAKRVVRWGGLAAAAAGVVGVVGGVLLAVVPPQVPEQVFSYPLTPAAHGAIQVVFAAHHFALAFGFAAFWFAGLAGRGRFAGIAAWSSVGAMAVFGVHEFAVAFFGHIRQPSAAADVVGSIYGVLTLLIGVALTLFGVAAVRARVLRGPGRWSLLAAGVYIFVPLVPMLALSFVAARFALVGWQIVFVWFGLVMIGWARAGVAVDAGGRADGIPGPAVPS